jgi:ABC-type bacteriocin/lantibiotic exporter with double-glycine peptidase domain
MTRRTLSIAALGAGLAIIVSPKIASDYFATHRSSAKSFRAALRGARFLTDTGLTLQQSFNDCGAASLKMVLKTFGVERDLSDLAHELNTGPKGTTLWDLRETSEREGVPARSWRLRKADLGSVPLPAIAWIGGNHYVVIRARFADGDLDVDDPALGRLRWSTQSFARAWSGETLVFDSTWFSTVP